MPPGPRDIVASSAKRRRELQHRTRGRKKHRRLDAICDEPSASYLVDRILADDGGPVLRRSSRIRRAPDLLDSSPVTSTRMNNVDNFYTAGDIDGKKKGKCTGKEGVSGRSDVLEMGETVSQMYFSLREEGDWKSRLRTRAGKNRVKLSSTFTKPHGGLRKSMLSLLGDKKVGVGTLSSRRRCRQTDISIHDATKTGNKDKLSPLIDKDYNNALLAERSFQADVSRLNVDDQLDSEQSRLPESLEKFTGVIEEVDFVNASAHDEVIHHTVIEGITHPPCSQVAEEHGSDGHGSDQYRKHPECLVTIAVEKDRIQETVHSLKGNGQGVSVSGEKIAGFRVKEGRRCGLCGCGSDGRPPKKLVHESFDSENETYDGSTASEEPNYNNWDGFGGEPGWLGRLLGPMHDRFGIARVWVHQHCAVWSPEVYFANLGCLKNVRAALCRGRALKCSRCGRPGATIGCRVDRCPKTYHLPCSRIEGCIFDHRKFLIACSDHRRFFQPHGNNRAIQIRKMKAKKMRLDLRKVANEASRKDMESEEKWLENWGEDEEFLKREGRRLHRDILRIAPIYIGGSSESKHLYQGWESLAGLEHVIQCMKEVVLLPLLYPEFFANLGLTPPRGVLLHGYPGTGKTHAVRALIGACSRGDKKIAYFTRKGADCLGKYVGDAERQLRLLFQVAERCQPSIIFFDEIDGLAPCRSRQQDQTHSSVVSTLLSLLDGLKSRGSVIVIGATNRPDAVDPALRRPGRFDREIYFPLPSKKDRSSILSLHTRSWPKPLSGSLLSWIANTTVGYAGADLQALCAQAAIHALKRNCALQQLLSSAAKGTVRGKLPCLPSFKVEEKDWLAALSLAPPPCSRREAGLAVNDIVASPLPAHLSPCFLLPLSLLLVSLYIDERICLSPMLIKASTALKNFLALVLEQKGLPVDFWWSHLHYLIREPFIAAKIRSMLSHCGLIIGSLGSNYPVVLDQLDDESIENDNFDSPRINPSTVYMHKGLRKNYPLQAGKGIGFRTLISGARRSGQRHLASCILQGFMGHEEIRMVTLATISLEGHGDMNYGLNQILLKCLDVGGCIIYMPRIDLWALDENIGTNIERQANPEKELSMIETDTVRRKGVSEMWNSFVKQVESAGTSTSLTILATCELEKGDLPHGLIRFFSTDVHSRVDFRPTECTIPRFFLHTDGKLELELVINSAAEQLSYDLVQHYLKLINERIHNKDSGDVHKGPHVDINSEANKENSHHALVTSQAQVHDAVTSNGGSSCINDSNIEGTNVRPLPPRTKGDHAAPLRFDVQDSFPRTIKGRKGNLSLAIATFGYQILRFPQFAELVWLTSKLKEGPCTEITGARKHWPFNACVMHTEYSHEKRVSGPNSCNVNYMVSAGVVRGLIAVGLLAYRGVYTSVSEVSTDVRRVLELLVGQIRAKLFGRKDRYCYLRVMSQVAYLDDMVKSWGYMLESLQADKNMAEVNSKQFLLGRLQFDNVNAGSIDITDNQPNIQVHVKSNNIAPEISPQGVPKSSNVAPEISPQGDGNGGEFANTFKENGDYASANFSGGILSCFQQIASKELTIGGLESSLSGQRLRSLDQIPSLTKDNRYNNVSELVISDIERGTSKRCTSLDTVPCSNHMGSIPIEQLDDSASYIFQENESLSKGWCLYTCCSNCVHMVNEMAHKMISSYLKLDGCYSVDDVHDIITSCSLNILASFKKLCISGSSAQSQLEEDGDDVFKRKTCHCKALMKIEFLPAECNCHTNVEDNTSTGSDSSSLLETKLTYFFRDGVLVPSIPYRDSDLHCKFQKICLCSVVMILVTIKHTLD